MTPAGPSPEKYDVFLAHGSGDKPLVKELYDVLTARGFSVFLDSEELSGAWRSALERALELSRCIALCVGPAGPGRWTKLEIDFGLRRNVVRPVAGASTFNTIPN